MNNITHPKYTPAQYKLYHSMPIRTVRPSFKQINYQKTMQKASFNIWNYTDNYVIKQIQKLKKAEFSTDKSVMDCEKYLLDKGVNVRFHNDMGLADYIMEGVNTLIKNDIKLPPNILFLPSIVGHLGILGLTYELRESPMESPIAFSHNISKLASRPNQGASYNYHSTTNRCHTFYHETGHWLHYQNGGYDAEKNHKTFAATNLNKIAQSLSKRAIASKDGSELCAEYFAGIIHGLTYPEYINQLVKDLGFEILRP